MSEKDFVQVAKLGKTVGLKGYVKLHNLSDFSSQFKKDATFFIKNTKEMLKIKHYNANNSTVLFENYEDIEKAKELTNLILFQSIEKSRQTCKLKKDEFFYFDILECEVFEEDKRLGKVVDILETGASYLFEIQSDEKWVEKKYPKIFFIPYLDKFVKNIDIEKRQIFCTQDAFLILENSTKFSFVSLFPNLMEFYFQDSILARAKEKKLFKLNFYNPRDFSKILIIKSMIIK